MRQTNELGVVKERHTSCIVS